MISRFLETLLQKALLPDDDEEAETGEGVSKDSIDDDGSLDWEISVSELPVHMTSK
jgi:hypothetical protein